MSDTRAMSDEELAQIRERAGRATDKVIGVWNPMKSGADGDHHFGFGVFRGDGSPVEMYPVGESRLTGDDVHLFSCAKDYIYALLAEVDRLREKLSAIDGVLQKCDRGSRDGWPGALLVIADIVEDGSEVPAKDEGQERCAS